MTGLRFEWRPLAAGEFDHERLWLGLGVACCLTVAAGLRAGLQPPRCFFHLATGYPCPGCGSTRAVLQLVHGHAGAAFAYNPLITMAVLAGLGWAVYAAGVLALRLPRLRVREVSRRWGIGLRVGLFAALGANWWWVLAHHW